MSDTEKQQWSANQPLPGACRRCGASQVVIDRDLERPNFFAYCTACGDTSCNGADPEEVARNWLGTQGS